VVIPDITFELARNNEDMYLFSPYDIERVTSKAMSDLSISEHYRAFVDNPAITKKKVNAKIFSRLLPKSSLNPAILISCLKISPIGLISLSGRSI